MLRILEAVTVVIGIISAVAGVFWFMDDRHAKAEESNITTLEVKAEILDRDIKKDAEARVYYKDIQLVRELEPAENKRLEYLEEQLGRKYDDQKIITEALIDLKSE